MKRFLMDDLLRWKNKMHRKPLIIRGARQVGKTWIMKEFGRLYYKNTVYINFDNNERMKQVFSLDMDIKRIISALKIEVGKNIDPDDTLLIFDEIQEVPRHCLHLSIFMKMLRNIM